MKNKPEIKFISLLENIRHRFAFLFRRGFQIVSIIFLDENYEDWQVTLATEDCIIKIYSYLGRVDLALSIPQLYNAVGLLELGDLVSAPAQELLVKETPDLLGTAQLLEKYIDEILGKIKKMLLLLSFDDPPAPSGKLATMFLYN